MLSLEGTYALLNSTSITLRLENNHFYSQDNVDIGSGNYARLSLAHLVRSGYPDISLGSFFDIGRYKEKSGAQGVLDQLDKGLFPSLTEDFYNVGLSLSYGMANSTAYTRVWRPYFELNPYYNGVLKEYNFGFNAGYGGKVWHQDHLSIGAAYSESVYGVGGKTLEFYLKYQFMYSRP
ncbi:MAG: hypothetical protein IE916_10715 [Epsilonproteobacteria bacterium]|nr:hypothetical protein [Campylobacterota bacterium]